MNIVKENGKTEYYSLIGCACGFLFILRPRSDGQDSIVVLTEEACLARVAIEGIGAYRTR